MKGKASRLGEFLRRQSWSFSAKPTSLRVITILGVMVFLAGGLSCYFGIEDRRCTERAIYFASWNEGGGGCYHFAVDSYSYNPGEMRNALDKTSTEKCIPIVFYCGAEKGRDYVCGNKHMTEGLQLFGFGWVAAGADHSRK